MRLSCVHTAVRISKDRHGFRFRKLRRKDDSRTRKQAIRKPHKAVYDIQGSSYLSQCRVCRGSYCCPLWYCSSRVRSWTNETVERGEKEAQSSQGHGTSPWQVNGKQRSRRWRAKMAGNGAKMSRLLPTSCFILAQYLQIVCRE